MGPTKSLTTLAGDLSFAKMFANVEGLGLVCFCSKLT